MIARRIDVAAGILEDEQGCVLIARRHDGSHAGGAWEFPGGKLDPGEAPVDALRRELAEEIGIEVGVCEHLMTYAHEYAERVVTLHVFRVTEWAGEPAGLEGQPLRWLRVDRLIEEGLLPADRPIVEKLMDQSAASHGE